MPLPALLFPLVLLLATSCGVGLLIARCAGRSDSLVSGLIIPTLTGLLGLAALLPNLAQLAVPYSVVLGIAYALAVAGWLGAGAANLRPDVPGLVGALLCAALLAAPMVVAAVAPPMARDAVAIWWPKVKEVASGELPMMVIDVRRSGTIHHHPYYPRGLAWLAALASPGSEPDPRWVRLLPALFAWLGATAALRWGRLLRSAGPVLATILLLLLPAVALRSCSGHADIVIASALTLVGMAIGLGRGTRRGWLLAAVAAAGAASIKEEGAVILIAVVAWLAAETWRGRNWRPAVIGLAACAMLLPWWLARTQVSGTVVTTALDVLAAPGELLVPRTAALGEGLWYFFTDPGVLLDKPGSQQPSAVAWLVLVVLLILLPRGPRRIPVFPAVLLLVAGLAIYLVTPNGLSWHIATSFERVLIQVAPLLLIAAADRLTLPPPSASIVP